MGERPPLWTMREVLVGALFGAVGVLLPILFHAVGLGRAFLPMHLPILIAGFFLSPLVAAATGFVEPWASCFLTGMPPLPTAVLMSLELPILSAMASVLHRVLKLNVWVSTIGAIVARILWDIALLATVVAPLLQLPPGAFGITAVIVGAPGIGLQLVVAPAVVLALKRARPQWGQERDEAPE